MLATLACSLCLLLSAIKDYRYRPMLFFTYYVGLRSCINIHSTVADRQYYTHTIHTHPGTWVPSFNPEKSRLWSNEGPPPPDIVAIFI